jgi:hypothetical protein
VARDSSGTISNCWTKRYSTTDPCIAEAMAEGDAKICVVAINSENEEIPWRILTIIINAKTLVSNFCSCSFNWVRRDANFVAHTLAKVASSRSICLSCNSTNLSPSLASIEKVGESSNSWQVPSAAHT